jgi:hypothetical protein
MTMSNQLTAYGLGLLWVGSMALGGLVLVRQKPLPSLSSVRPPALRTKSPAKADATHSSNSEDSKEPALSPEQAAAQAQFLAVQRLHSQRRMITLLCQFVGSGGIIAGLGLLAVGVIK